LTFFVCHGWSILISLAGLADPQMCVLRGRNRALPPLLRLQLWADLAFYRQTHS
jgi:hypothetical protein